MSSGDQSGDAPLKLTEPPKRGVISREVEALKLTLTESGWQVWSSDLRAGISEQEALKIARRNDIPHRVEATGPVNNMGRVRAKAWFPPWFLRVVLLYKSMTSVSLDGALTMLKDDEELRAATFALADVGKYGEAAREFMRRKAKERGIPMTKPREKVPRTTPPRSAPR